MNSTTDASSGEGEETAYTTTGESVFTPGNSVAQSLVFYAVFCGQPFYHFLAITLSFLLLLTASAYLWYIQTFLKNP
jgi:hypothetical protein